MKAAPLPRQPCEGGLACGGARGVAGEDKPGGFGRARLGRCCSSILALERCSSIII